MGGIEPNPGPAAAATSVEKHCRSSLKSLRFGVLNARSAVSKAAEIHDTIDSNNLDVLVLTETWIASNAHAAIKQDIAPQGFSVCHAHRTALKTRGKNAGKTKGGGGVAIVYRNTLTIKDINRELSTGGSFESLAIKITGGNKHLNVVAIY